MRHRGELVGHNRGKGVKQGGTSGCGEAPRSSLTEGGLAEFVG